jgi:hypothetical protein
MNRIPTFVNCENLCAETGLNKYQVKAMRMSGRLIKGIHVQYVAPRALVYNLPLILDLIANSHDELAHQRAINVYLSSLPSNQKTFKTPTAIAA